MNRLCEKGLSALALALALGGAAHAETEISNVPMGVGITALPNLMFILDASGSMNQNYMPDHVASSGFGGVPLCRDSSDLGTVLNACASSAASAGQPPFYLRDFNFQFYNPATTYTPGVTPEGDPLPEQDESFTAGWTKVQVDPYLNPGSTVNLVSGYWDSVWCDAFANSSHVHDASRCRRNRADHVALQGAAFAPFVDLVGDYAYPNESYYGTLGLTRYSKQLFVQGAPYYYRVKPIKDSATMTMPAKLAGSGVVFCKTAVAGSSAEQKVFQGFGTSDGTEGSCSLTRTPDHPYVRFGPMERVDIVPSVTKYNVGTAYERSYEQEMTNFANWYAYYRSRILAMKSTAGKVFAGIGPEFRLGFITICPFSSSVDCSSPVTGQTVVPEKFLKIDRFLPEHKGEWFKKLYGTQPSGFTPLVEALSRVGRYFAGGTDGINQGMRAGEDDDPVQYSCQQNFALLTTDGFTNVFASADIDGKPVGDQDSAQPRPYYDSSAAQNTISDVAMYYYATDLRTSGSKGALGVDVSNNNVRTTDTDPNSAQHMVTFTLGLGVSGTLNYRSDYVEAARKSPPEGDFGEILAGTKDWPKPVENSLTAVDDLWHAAVNGRGRDFSAQNPEALAESLAGALSAIVAQTGAAAAAATSNLEPVAGDNYAYTATFRTREWDGNLEAREIILEGPDAGKLQPTPVWQARDQLDARVNGGAGDTETPPRKIYTLDMTNADTRLKEFFWDKLNAEEKKFFTLAVEGPRTLSQLAEWAPGGGAPNADRLATALKGENLVNYLRGHWQHEIRSTRPLADRVYRVRQHVLGDIANSQPQFVREPQFDYEDPNYGRNVSPEGAANFKALRGDRRGIVLVGGNDGMLHAFDAGSKPTEDTKDPGTGAELWAYLPKLVMAELYHLADRGYDDAHRFYVDGTPAVGDVCYKVGGGCSAEEWRTIVVAGLNGGGRGYFALDITDTTAPKLLWEFGNTDVMGKGAGYYDESLGLSYGNPLITKIDDPEGSGKARWVVMFTSGLNNVPGKDPITGDEIGGGDGKGYLYIIDPETGKLLLKIGTGAGKKDEPSGLTKLAGYVADSTRTNNFSDRVYGVDMLGNVWRFDVNDKYAESNPYSDEIPEALRTSRGAHLLAVLKDEGGKRQPISVKPELGDVLTKTGVKTLVMVGTGRFLGEKDRADKSQQTIYAIKDSPDKDVAVTLNPARATMVEQVIGQLDADTRTVTNEVVDLATKDGWYIDFPAGGSGSTGERVNINMTLQLGTLVVTSNIPNDDACSVGGESWVNFVDFRTGGPVSLEAGGIAGRRITSSLTVGLNVVRLPNGMIPGIATTAAGEHVKAELAFGAAPPQGRRVSWREIVD